MNDESRQLLKPNVVDTTVFNQLPPKHKEVNDFYNQLENENNIIDRVETTIDKVATQHNVNTDIMYNYINNETEYKHVSRCKVQTVFGNMKILLRLKYIF